MITNKAQIHPIGIGTFGLGADRFEYSEKNSNWIISYKDVHLQALLASFEAGQNYIETSFIYANGETMKFLASFFKQIPREKIFITVKLERFINNKNDIQEQLDKYLTLMGLDYADSLILHAPSFSNLPLQTTYEEMNNMVKKGKTRYLSWSNLSINQLKSINEDIWLKLFSIEALYNLECKINEDTWLMQYCEDNEIIFACYQPLRRNRTANRNFPLLLELANKYNKTQNQILINWIVKWKKLNPLIKASSVNHVKENLASLDFVIEDNDMKKLDLFRSEEFDLIANKIDREDKNEGIAIYKYANQFD